MKLTHITLLTLLVATSCMSPAQEPKRLLPNAVVQELEGLNYPQIARNARLSGRVVVQVQLDDAGRVISVSALPSGLTKGLIVPDALSNAWKWRFQPNPSKEAVIIYDFRIEQYCTDFEIEHSVPSTFRFQAPNFVTVTACPEPINPATSAAK